VTTCAPRLSAGFEIAGHSLELLVGDERAKLGLGVETMSDAELRGTVGNTLHQPIKHALMGIEPRAGGAALPHVEEDRARCSVDRDIHVGVGEHDSRRFATQSPGEDTVIVALVRTSVRRIKLAMPSTFAYQAEYRTAHAALTASSH